MEVGDQDGKARDEADTSKATTPPRCEGKWGSKVSEADQVKHPLAGGQWEGLSAVRKGGEIRIEVHPSQYSVGNEQY